MYINMLYLLFQLTVVEENKHPSSTYSRGTSLTLQLLNKPYENEVTFREQINPKKPASLLIFGICTSLKGLDLSML